MSANSPKEHYINLARIAIEQVNDKFLLGALNKTSSLKSMGLKLYLAQMNLFTQFRKYYNSEEGTELAMAIYLSDDFQSATCGEMAHTAIAIIMSEDNEVKIDLVDLTYHQMLVIGLDPNSVPNDINTWGDNAIICDPWAGIYYEASKFYEMQANNKIPVITEIDINTGEALEVKDNYLEGNPIIFKP